MCLEWITKLMREPLLRGDWSAFEDEEEDAAASLEKAKAHHLAHLLYSTVVADEKGWDPVDGLNQLPLIPGATSEQASSCRHTVLALWRSDGEVRR